jgi:ubiquinone/menaquinone biosynthesis C-methylase UbiE
MHETTFKRHLVEQAGITKGHRVLDLGCGTATLILLIKKVHPDAEVVGLDGDAKVLEIARAKSADAGMDIALDYGMAFELPYPEHSFHRVLSSLLLHHLTRENKLCTLREAFRVLHPGGEMHIADFGKPHNVLMYSVSLIVRWLEEAADNVKGLLPKMFADAGFEEIRESARFMTLFGTLSLYRARKPE